MWRKPDRGNDCDCGCGGRARGRDPRLGLRIGRSSWLLGLLSPAGHKKGAAVTAAPVGRTLKEVGELHRLGSLCAAVDFRPRRPRGRARAFRVHPPMPSLFSMSSWASGYIIWPSFMGSPSSWAAAALAVSAARSPPAAARRGGQHRKRKGVPLRPGRLVFLNQLGAHHASDGAARDVRMPVVMLLGNVRVRHGAIHPHVGDGIAVAVGAGVGLRAGLPLGGHATFPGAHTGCHAGPHGDRGTRAYSDRRPRRRGPLPRRPSPWTSCPSPPITSGAAGVIVPAWAFGPGAWPARDGAWRPCSRITRRPRSCEGHRQYVPGELVPVEQEGPRHGLVLCGVRDRDGLRAARRPDGQLARGAGRHTNYSSRKDNRSNITSKSSTPGVAKRNVMMLTAGLVGSAGITAE